MIITISPHKTLNSRWRGAFTTGLAVVLLTVPLFTGSAASAPLSDLLSVTPSNGEKSEVKPTTATPEQQMETIKRALAAAEAERDRGLTGSSGLPPQDAKKKLRLLDGLVARLKSRINLINEREELRRIRVVADQTAKGWTGFTEPPPYSILMVDEIMSSVLAARAKSRGLGINQGLLEQQVTQFRESAQQAREREQHTADELQLAQSPEEKSAASRQEELAEIRARHAESMAELITLRYEVLGERIGVATAELGLLERQLTEAQKGMVFSRTDLDKALAGLKSIRSNLEQELEEALARDARSRSELARSRQELDSFNLRHSKARNSAATAERRAELEAGQRAALAWVDSSRFETEVVSVLIAINKSSATFWEKRYSAATGKDAEKRRAVLAEFRANRERLKPWLEFAGQQLEMYQAAEHEQERLTRNVIPGPLHDAESRLLAARQLQRELAERQKAAIGQADVERQSWLEDIERIQQTRTISEMAKEWFGAVPHILRSVWRFELFAIEDSVEVAGQQVVTSRGVTVGKSVGALLLFLAGYFIAAFLARRAQDIMITRFRVNFHQANVIRRWLMALTVFLLLVITLNLARIPLTVFAFLGGALAIGVGFGTQTLIKNFISGILILLERNVKVGDTIDVDGVVGRIVTVDLRASTILGFDGVETVIPNSTFLENKVTNWTHTNARLRRIVRVGVAYGSQINSVRDILAECAIAHSHILKDPPPEVLFEDFGDSSLVFALYFWIEHSHKTNPLKVASDLRFMIDQRFAEENIVLAFPQRDVHFDTAQPLRVELVSPASALPSEKTAL